MEEHILNMMADRREVIELGGYIRYLWTLHDPVCMPSIPEVEDGELVENAERKYIHPPVIYYLRFRFLVNEKETSRLRFLIAE